MIARLLRHIADTIDPQTVIDLEPWTPPVVEVSPLVVKCPNCGWDGKSDAIPLLADLLEDARRQGERRHASQSNTAHGQRRAS